MPLANLGILLLALGLLIGLVLAPRTPLQSPALALLRGLFPSWRFFEAISPPARLRYRVLAVDDQPGPWIDALVPEAHGVATLLLNARGNLFLACQSLVERLDSDLESAPDDVTRLVSYRLVQTLVAQRAAVGCKNKGCRFQFRLSAHDADEQEIFVSPVHEA